MKTIVMFVLSVLFLNTICLAQEHAEAKHRVAVVLGHSYVSLENNEILSIPSFGLDYEYWLSNHWGVGIFTDVELIANATNPTIDGVMVEREYPVVVTLDVLWNPRKHLEFVVGPGFVTEKNKIKSLVRFGVEYDLTLGHHWDVAPNLFYDQKLDGGYAVSMGIGIGKSF